MLKKSTCIRLADRIRVGDLWAQQGTETAYVHCPNLKWNFASVTPDPAGINRWFCIEKGVSRIEAINSLIKGIILS